MEFSACPQCGNTISSDAALCPGCALVLTHERATELAELPPFFAVSLLKLAVMSVVTLGLYQLYWFYRNWQRVRVREQVDIRPSLRAYVFGFFYCYPCFKRIRKLGRKFGILSRIPILMLSIGWVGMTFVSQLPAPAKLISLLGFVFLLPVQAYVNRINSAITPTHDSNSRLTRWNWVGVAIGGVLLLLVFVGLFLPAPVKPG